MLVADVREVRDRVRRLERGDDALGPREKAEALERLGVGARDVADATGLVQIRVLGTHTRIVEAGRDGMRLVDLSVGVLEDEAARAVQYAFAPADDRRGVLPALDA